MQRRISVPVRHADRADLVSIRTSLFVATWVSMGLIGCGEGETSGPGQAPGAGPLAGVRQDESPPSPAEVAAAGSEGSWKTEELNSAAGRQLHLLVDDFESDSRIDRAVLEKIATADFRGNSVVGPSLQVVHQARTLTIRRHVLEDFEGTGDKPGDREGVDGLASILDDLVAGWEGWSDVHLHFKITSVELQPDHATTRVLMEAGARKGDRFEQLRGWWLCRWQLAGKTAPRLSSLHCQSLEQVRGTSPGGRWLVDSTAAVLQPAPQVSDQLSRSVDHFRGRLQAEVGVALHGHQGLAIGDVNGDGLDDLYLAQPGGMPNRLLVQQQDGTVVDTARAAGVDWLDRSRSALLIDLDNDGDQDLACVLNISLVLMENDGTGTFTERDVVFSGGDPYSLAAADFDSDGDLDLYVTGYGAGFLANQTGEGPLGEAIPYPYHDANNGGPNLLLRNEGTWQFRDATSEVGLDEHNRRWSFAASFADYDADGDLDLYVANDYGRNCLYRNIDGRFRDVAADAGVEDIAAGMSVAWCDYNGDGLPDLHVGNMFSSAGERIAYQRRFQRGVDETIRRQFQRHARGNTLFENKGDGTFRDVSVPRGITMGRWSWGSPFVDINNDGRPDLVVANGYITGEDTNDL